MDREELMDELTEAEALLADGFEDALIGVMYRFGQGPIALYNQDRCIEILMQRDGMEYDEAIEYLDFNVLGAWVGDSTPAFCRLIDRPEEGTEQG